MKTKDKKEKATPLGMDFCGNRELSNFMGISDINRILPWCHLATQWENVIESDQLCPETFWITRGEGKGLQEICNMEDSWGIAPRLCDFSVTDDYWNDEPCPLFF